MSPHESLPLTIAGVRIELRVSPRLAPSLRERFAGWLGGTPSISLDVSDGLMPVAEPDKHAVLSVRGPHLHFEAPGLVRVTVDVDRGSGEICYATALENAGLLAPAGGVVAALRLLVSTLVTRRGALMLHASAVRFPAGAAAFVGPSKAGKSTIASMFPDDTVLSDELVAVEIEGDCARAHSTPFSSAHVISPRRCDAPMRACFLLQQAKSLAIEPLSPPQAAGRLASCVAVVRGDDATERRAFDTLCRLLHCVPCRRLSFPLDAVEVARDRKSVV